MPLEEKKFTDLSLIDIDNSMAKIQKIVNSDSKNIFSWLKKSFLYFLTVKRLPNFLESLSDKRLKRVSVGIVIRIS